MTMFIEVVDVSVVLVVNVSRGMLHNDQVTPTMRRLIMVFVMSVY